MYYEITHYAIARSVRFGAVHRCDGKKVRKSVEEEGKIVLSYYGLRRPGRPHAVDTMLGEVLKIHRSQSFRLILAPSALMVE